MPTNPLIAPAKPITLTVDILVQCGADSAACVKYVDSLNELLPLYGITTLLRLAHFLAQLIWESDKMRATHEYASGAAYEGRTDLGNIQKGDGIRYKGRGGFQTTGRANYTAFAKRYAIDCVNHPELLEQPRWWVVSALYYWQSRNLSLVADKDDGVKVTKLINGGVNGLAQRMALLVKCKLALAPLFQ